jgi:hypothetical protein
MGIPQSRPGVVTVDLEAPGQKDGADDQERHQRQHLDQ